MYIYLKIYTTSVTVFVIVKLCKGKNREIKDEMR